jgi:sugar lactone lactonase YvrE
MRYWWLALLGSLPASIHVAAQEQLQAVPFDDARWTIVGGAMAERQGRSCLEGTGLLSDLEFANGVLEVDLFVTGERSYPGLVFRLQSSENYERFYVRPHRAGLYPDAMQYTPVINRVAGWQLYNGPGYTAVGQVPDAEWFRLRLEVRDTQARVFVGAATDPALRIDRLEHGISSGGVGVMGPADGTACFADFRYAVTDTLAFEPPAPRARPEGVITEWEISRSFKSERANRERYPRFYSIHAGAWESVAPDERGIVDVARYRQRTPDGADAIMARTVVRSDRRRDVTFGFGYSDEIDLFLNGHKVFAGRSGYQSRDPSFLGIVGLHDEVRLTLEPGLNEIFFFLSESFGGWGFLGTIDGAVLEPLRDHSVLEKVWETPDTFLTPESVLYDAQREVLYVTNFDNTYQAGPAPTGYISRLALDGALLDHRWVEGLASPAGIAMHGDRLYALERGYLTEIDVERGAVVARHAIEGSDFLNDLAIGPDGAVYMTDTRPSNRPDSRIYRFKDGSVDVWLEEGINWANGLYLHGNELLVGNSGDGILKAVDLDTRRIRDIVCLGARLLDGIRVDGSGNYLVSHWEGQLYRVDPDGTPVEILDLLPQGLNAADFEYVPESRLVIIPTFVGDRVVAYRFTD